MAFSAGNIGMSTGQGKVRLGIVVKGRGHPALGIVAIAAMGLAVLGNELRIVGVVVTSLTLLRSAFEARFVTASGLVAIAADDGAMSTHKREFGFGVIETVNVGPGFYIVAGLTTEGCAVGALASHAIVEFALVWILVTGRAGAVFVMEWKNFIGAACGARFVTIGAGNSNVRACQREASGLMLGDGIGGAVEIDNGVAGLATIVEWSGGKLIVVGVLVAIEAGGEFHFVNGVFARGDVALSAFHGDVLAL